MELFPGMVVAVRAWYMGVAVWHMGIINRYGRVMSNKRTERGLFCEPWQDFIGSEKWEIVGFCHVGDYEELLARLDNPMGRTDYHDTEHNCEHWLFRMLNRIEESPQLARAKDNGLTGVAVGAGLALAVAAGPVGWLFALGLGAAVPQWIGDIPSIAKFYSARGYVRRHVITHGYGTLTATIY